MAAIKVFTVSHGGIRIRVRLLATIEEVHREHQSTARQLRNGKTVFAFFLPAASPSAKYIGTIVLPLEGKMEELVPHEVTHAVLHKAGGVLASDDEPFCTAVGMLSARIAHQVKYVKETFHA